jgi:uncharacterized protein YndB with AHSA1/START domain
MTRHKSFKRLVRTRMDKTGESYTTARSMILAAEQSTGTQPPVLATSDEAIRRRTGRGWEEWFDLLDSWSASEQPHKEIARRVAADLGIEPLVWEAQAVTYSYERARGMREVGQRDDGFTITASKTVAVPVERLYQAFVDERRRAIWLPDGRLRERSATPPKTAHFDWADDGTRVHVTFAAKGDAKSTATLEHARLTDATAAERAKEFWHGSLSTLKARLEAGEIDV